MSVHDLAFRALALLPPEAAHVVGTAALRAGLGPRNASAIPGDAPTLFGKGIANRVGLSAGADKTGLAIAAWRDVGFGFEEAGTVTMYPRKGNAGTRIWRMRDGVSLVNWMGLPNPGIVAFATNLEEFRRTPRGTDHCVGASLSDMEGGPGALERMTRRLDGLVDFVAVNLSCPNVKGHADEAWGTALAQVEEVAEASKVPVVAKLAPVTDMEAFASACRSLRDAGATGFATCNTAGYASRSMLARAPGDWPRRDGECVGGYSGPELLPISLTMVRTARETLGGDVTIVGVGGIQSASDAAAMRAAGADAIQAYTAVVRLGPDVVADLVRGAA